MLADGLYVMVSVTVCMRKVAAGCWWHSDVLYIGPSLVAFMIAGPPANRSLSLPCTIALTTVAAVPISPPRAAEGRGIGVLDSPGVTWDRCLLRACAVRPTCLGPAVPGVGYVALSQKVTARVPAL